MKLLRAIQEGEVEPVGARKAVKVDVRIVSATNRDLIADVKTGRFREDLFYRLHVFPITVPPLRERPADIPALARHFLARFAAEEGKRIRIITPEALRVLGAHHWPGNIRQLENAVFRAVVLAESDCIGVDEFPQVTAQVGNKIAAAATPEAALADAAQAPAVAPAEEFAPDLMATDLEDAAGVSPAFVPLPAPPAPPASGEVLPLLDAEGEVRPLDEVESDLIRYAVAHYRGQMSEVARRLQIGRSTLYRKLEALGLNSERAAAD